MWHRTEVVSPAKEVEEERRELSSRSSYPLSLLHLSSLASPPPLSRSSASSRALFSLWSPCPTRENHCRCIHLRTGIFWQPTQVQINPQQQTALPFPATTTTPAKTNSLNSSSALTSPLLLSPAPILFLHRHLLVFEDPIT